MYSSDAVQPIAVCQSDGPPNQLTLICFRSSHLTKQERSVRNLRGGILQATPRMGLDLQDTCRRCQNSLTLTFSASFQIMQQTTKVERLAQMMFGAPDLLRLLSLVCSHGTWHLRSMPGTKKGTMTFPGEICNHPIGLNLLLFTACAPVGLVLTIALCAIAIGHFWN